MEHGEGITAPGVAKQPSIEASAHLGGLSHSSDDVEAESQNGRRGAAGKLGAGCPDKSMCQMAEGGTEKENPAVAPRADLEVVGVEPQQCVTSLSRAG